MLVTASIVSTNITDETAAALDTQIKRHLDGASYEIAAATSKRFKVVEASLVDPMAYALRDAVAENRPLVGGGYGYTLPVSPTLLGWNYDTQATSKLSPGMATYPEGRGLTSSVDLTTSAVYYSDGTSNPSVSPPTLSARDTARIEASAGVDNWLPALFGSHSAVQQAYMGLELEDHAYAAFRSFPAYDASAQTPSLFACNRPGTLGCYDASARGWYISAKNAGRVTKRVNGVDVLGLGKTIVTDPYQDAGSDDWMVTTARAVYAEGDTDNIVIGVVAVDMLLSSIRESILRFSMLETGFGTANFNINAIFLLKITLFRGNVHIPSAFSIEISKPSLIISRTLCKSDDIMLKNDDFLMENDDADLQACSSTCALRQSSPLRTT